MRSSDSIKRTMNNIDYHLFARRLLLLCSLSLSGLRCDDGAFNAFCCAARQQIQFTIFSSICVRKCILLSTSFLCTDILLYTTCRRRDNIVRNNAPQQQQKIVYTWLSSSAYLMLCINKCVCVCVLI